MRHETIKNDFFNQFSQGPEKSISLAHMIEICLGRRIYSSKRLAPAGVICNARIYTENGEFLYSSDINVFESAAKLSNIAKAYDVEIFVFAEHGDGYYWRSSMPGHWQGSSVIEGEWCDAPRFFHEVKPHMEEMAKQQARNWLLDRGLVRRTFKEYLESVQYAWGVRDVIYENNRAMGRNPVWSAIKTATRIIR